MSIPLIAQVENGNFSISGTIVNSVNGEPVKNAQVSVTRNGELDRSTEAIRRRRVPDSEKKVTTGVGGEFLIGALSSGQYTLAVQKPGFMQDGSPEAFRHRSISLAGSVTGLQLKVAPLGVIEGRALDQYGEPIRGVAIHALLVNIRDGSRQAYAPRNVSTDDRGGYRLWNLFPGKYYLKAAGRSAATYAANGATMPVILSSWEAFAPAYSNGAHEMASASPITIEPGSHVVADFKLELQPAFKIRGEISGISSSVTVNFTLLQEDEDASPGRVSLNFNTGKFELHDITPGTYLVRATQGEKRGEIPVIVRGGDVEGVVFGLGDGVEVKGAIHTPAPARPPDFSHGIPRDFDFNSLRGMTPVSCQLSLKPARSADPILAFKPQNDEWIAPKVFPGQYRLQTRCYGGYAVSIVSGSADLRVNPVLTVPPGVSPPRIEVNAVSGGATIKGKIEASPIPETAGVLLVPSSASSEPAMTPLMNRGVLSSLPQEVDPLAAHSFLVPFIAPGDYTLYLFAKRDEVLFRDPEFLRSLAGGVSVHLADGDQQEVTLRTLVQ